MLPNFETSCTDFGAYTAWHKGQQRHRDGGPALVYKIGGEMWWKEGRLHRESGPAITYNCGYEEWWVNGEMHRLTGPALVHTCGSWHCDGACVNPSKSHEPPISVFEWWVHGRQLTVEEFDLYVDQIAGEVFIPPGKKLEHDPDVGTDGDIFYDLMEFCYDDEEDDEVGCDDEFDLYID